MTCNDKVTISLGSDCTREVEVDDVVEDFPSGCEDGFELKLEYPYGTNYFSPPNMVDASHKGRHITYKVTEIETGNSCWGNIKVEDKYPPQVECLDDTITCYQIHALPTAEELTAMLSDNCDGYPVVVDIVSELWEEYNCDSIEWVGKVTRTIQAHDVWGNSRVCEQQIWIERLSIDDVKCPDDIVVSCVVIDLLQRFLPIPVDPLHPTFIATLEYLSEGHLSEKELGLDFELGEDVWEDIKELIYGEDDLIPFICLRFCNI